MGLQALLDDVSPFPPRAHGLYDPRFEHDACGVGFVANLRGERSHQLLVDADRMLRRMAHRGASGAERNSGDGAGILTALPDRFFRALAKEHFGADLPPQGRFAVGNVFLPEDAAERAHCKRIFERTVRAQGQRFIGWRSVPCDPVGADLGIRARRTQPAIEQLFVGAAEGIDVDAFDRQLYIIRKSAGSALRSDARLRESERVYVCTLSPRVIVYKGMLTPEQLFRFYPDLRDWRYRSHLAMVHSRFSTNTFPSWDRAQPLRCMSHNGEINTLRGNVSSMHDRERVLKSERFGDELSKVFPIAEPAQSDSGSFDNVLELLLVSGRSLPASLMMMIPEAWQNNAQMSDAKRAFYEYHACLMEPWDGPASIAFTDGRFIGAVLDRNGLRPSRWTLTHDGFVHMSSEAGALPIEPSRVKEHGRLRPGRMFLVDFEEARMIPDDEVKAIIAAKRPYRQWLDEGRITLDDLMAARESAPPPSARIQGQTAIEDGEHSERLGETPSSQARLRARQHMFGMSAETVDRRLVPMVKEGRDPLGSMGNDAALACLSSEPRLIYDYFKQQFAQVTNPPIDSIREELFMSLGCYAGPEGNLLHAQPEHCRRLWLPHPILSEEEMGALRSASHPDLRTEVIDCTWPRSRGAAGLDASLRRIAREAEQAIDEGAGLLVLSDAAAGPERVPISSLLAVGAVHQHLVSRSKRTRTGILVESGEAREVHHHCCLIGFGADAIYPYLAFDTLCDALDASRESITRAYRKSVAKGVLKVLAKMGISTLQSYKGAQIFEAIGLSPAVMDACFAGTPSRLGGVDFSVLADDAVRRHERAYAPGVPLALDSGSQLAWRKGGERHMWDPTAITSLQAAARGDESAYWRFAEHADEADATRCTLRSLLRFKSTTSIPLDEVESAASIAARFATGAMSFGSISAETHETLALAMNRLGGKSNTGEGGESAARYLPIAGKPNPKRSAIKQVASGRFGVTIEYLAHAEEIQIKMAQGAKPGEGGELPGRKVNADIASVRHSTPGVGLISPPPHHDIYSIEDLAQLIYDLKSANPKARISVKLVSSAGVGTVAAGVAKAHAHHILISGHDGGTGASPTTSIKHAGAPLELGIAEAHQTLCLNGLRQRVKIQADGQLKTGRDVVIAALLGADEFGFSTAPLVTLGCLMMRKCHLNTCPVGIATQDPRLRERFEGLPEHVITYLMMVAEHARRIMAALGFATLDEMVGRVEVLELDPARLPAKASQLDLSALLTPARKRRPRSDGEAPPRRRYRLDDRLLEIAAPILESDLDTPIEAHLEIGNGDRAVGTRLSYHVARKGRALDDHTLHFRFEGTAGQSFGAWLAKGVTLSLEGGANDSMGKGLSGGVLALFPHRRATFEAHRNVIVGNVALYGAIRGSAYIAGVAGERFAVRNSGASAVVEGVGDHACEYMTGGRVAILGDVGRNFAAGMSGGVVYVFDESAALETRCMAEASLLRLGAHGWPDDEEANLRSMLEAHVSHTSSRRAASLLLNWKDARAHFVRVLPDEYAKAMAPAAQELRAHG